MQHVAYKTIAVSKYSSRSYSVRGRELPQSALFTKQKYVNDQSLASRGGEGALIKGRSTHQRSGPRR